VIGASRPLRIGMIGAGMVTQHHLAAWSEIPDAEVVAIADPDRSRAEARAQAFDIAHASATPAPC
jgi:predicted dehydrogenase